MNAIAALVVSSTLKDAALAYYAAEQAKCTWGQSAGSLLARAYLSTESALSALRAEGTRLDEIAKLEGIAHRLAPAYEENRNVQRDLSEAAYRARTFLDAFGHDRRLAMHLFALADEIGDDTPELEAQSTKVREVAEMIDAEDHS